MSAGPLRPSARPADLLPSRAHRRFLRTLGPVMLAQEAEEYMPVDAMTLGAPLRRVLEHHLATAGELRSGVLLGHQEGQILCVTHLLPSGYPPHLRAQDPWAMDPGYVLGAVDAARQSSARPIDWIGHWVMPADGQPPSQRWSLRQYEQARQRGLVGVDRPLLLFGEGDARAEMHALLPDERQTPHGLPVTWAAP